MTELRKIIECSSTSVTIELLQEYLNKKIEIVIRPLKEGPEENPKPKYDFSDFFGKLEWKGDALAEQKKLRDEWE